MFSLGWVNAVAVVVMAYLLGSVAFGVVSSFIFRLADPRSYGSRNPGATNVLRSGHRIAALVTLLGDGAKGWLAVFLARHFADTGGWGDITIACVAVAVFAGHLWPVFFRFQGGKGVATALGVLLGVDVWLALATVLSFAIILAFFRWVSFASMIAAVFAAFYQLLLFSLEPMTPAVIVMSALLIWRHSGNIDRLLKGKEPRLGKM